VRPVPLHQRSGECGHQVVAEQVPLLAYTRAQELVTSITYLSSRMETLLGRALEEIEGSEGFASLLHPDDRERVLAEHAVASGVGRRPAAEYRLLARDGSVVWVRDEAVFVHDGDNAPVLRGHCLDITAYKSLEAELRASDEQFRAVVANIPGAVYRCACDASWPIHFMSDHIEELCGHPAADFIENEVRTYGSIIHPDDRPYVVDRVDEALVAGTPYSLQYRLIHADGSARWIAEHGRAVLDERGRPVWLDGVIFDISRRKHAEAARDQAQALLQRQAEQNRHQALHDALTGLPNRILFGDRVRLAILAAARARTGLAVLMLDLDRFKEINDTLGHACGDLLLQEVGKRLEATVREGDSVARLGGDEFGLLLPRSSEAAVVEVVTRIRGSVERPFILRGLPVSVEASVGIAFYPDDGGDVEVLLQRADAAMYVAKGNNSGHAIFNPDEPTFEPNRLALVGELQRAIDERQLVLHYQPKVEVTSGRVVGVEALVRWRHPLRGLVPPDEFIPAVQHTSLIKPLTLYVIDEALRQCHSWLQVGRRLAIAVDVSPRNLIDREFPEDVAKLLSKWDVPPDLLELEITESAIIANPLEANAMLDRLSAMGIRLSLDDSARATRRPPSSSDCRSARLRSTNRSSPT